MQVRDEVCGMRLQRAEAVTSVKFQGETYRFCSVRCRRKFEEHPDWYVPLKAPGRSSEEDLPAGDAVDS
ncbi:MAG: YHS domain-containing protein [Gemmatimonadetes bacterium]|nr:YHS domain-containing protein [Gemmatimonadota bacterium]